MRKHYSSVVHRAGTEHFTIIDAHPYHTPVGRIDHKGAGNYVMGYDPHCPWCRKEHEEQENADGHDPA
jgi:hypothetical protein